MTGKNNNRFRRIGAVALFLAVGLGAIGGHALEEHLVALDRTGTWETAVLYHLVHGLALLVLEAVLPAGRLRSLAGNLFLAGIFLFSGSLYLLSLTDTGWLGAITPFGGIAFLFSWAIVALAGGKPEAS